MKKTTMTSQPLNLANAILAVTVGSLALTSLADDLDHAEVEPLPDPVVALAVESPVEDARPSPPRRPAGPFELGEAGRDDVLAWARQQGHGCEVTAMGRRLACSGSREDIVARFDGDGRLAGFEFRRWLDDGAEAESLFASAVDQLETTVGPATLTVGAEGFVDLPYERAARRFDYRGYEAKVVATHFGERGLLVRQRYRATK